VEPSGDAAKEGTACGEYLERLLTSQSIGTHAENGVPFDDDMKYYATDVANDITSDAASEVLCETRIDWGTRSGTVIRGQYDASFVGIDGALYVDDLKYGWKIVEVKENWQLIAYAIGEVIRRNTYFETIVLRIHQPRPHHEDGPTREWKITYEELLAYKEQIEVRMEQRVAGGLSLVTGPHCQYCSAVATACPAISKAFYHSVDVVHEFLQDDITNDELSAQLQLIDRVADIMKIKKSSLEDLAIHKIKNGEIIPNYVSDSKMSDRKWKKEISPDLISMLTGIDISEKIMLSPAKAEKCGVNKKLVAQMVDRHQLGRKLKYKKHSDAGNAIFGGEDPNVKK
jgi:hypothetical protein